MLQIVLWKWDQPGFKGQPYTAEHVNVMCSMLRRNLQYIPHRIICITDSSDGITECESAHLWTNLNDLPNASGSRLPSCYRRLKLYDPATQRDLGMDNGDRIMSIDLDTIICNPLREVIDYGGRFLSWELTGMQGRRVFNGSLQMFNAGDLAYIWKDFDPEKSPREAGEAGYRGSDQAWLSYKLINEPWAVGVKWPLVASYPLQNRVQGVLKRETVIVFFHGMEKPWTPNARFQTPWIDRYWRQ